MHHVGIDLAWGLRARTGLAVLDGAGRLVASASVRSDEEILAFLERWAPGSFAAAVDAPLVVPNETGRRPCEALVGQLFGRYAAGAYPANRGNPAFVPEPRGARLPRTLRAGLDPAVRPADGRRTFVEVYPHPAMVSLFGLTSVIPYKIKRGRELPALKAAYDELLGHVERTCGAVLRLSESLRWRELRAVAAGAVRKSELDAVEDEVDAVFCAFLAWLWATEPERLLVLGDVRSGYIVTPPPPHGRGQNLAASVDSVLADHQDLPDRGAAMSQHATTDQPTTSDLTQEREELLESLQRHRWFLRHTVEGLTDEQARLRPTVSALTLGGLVKHVASAEAGWAEFALRGPVAMEPDESAVQDYADGFRMLEGETLEDLLARYAEVAARTDELVRTLDLDASHPLPEAPWFEPGKRWSVRRVLLHILAETSQHAGHADILRESIDGQKTMG